MFGSSSRYHVGWDEKENVISLSSHVIFALLMLDAEKTFEKEYLMKKNYQPKVMLYFFPPGFTEFHRWLVTAKIKNTTLLGDIILCCEPIWVDE